MKTKRLKLRSKGLKSRKWKSLRLGLVCMSSALTLNTLALSTTGNVFAAEKKGGGDQLGWYIR